MFNIATVTLPRISARSLYLLALFQLVTGPLVLLTVLTFCKVTVQHLPADGLAVSLSKALQSDELQALFSETTDAPQNKSDKSKPKVKLDTAKLMLIAWSVPPAFEVSNEVILWPMKAETWVSAWAQAPPGPPPRVG